MRTDIFIGAAILSMTRVSALFNKKDIVRCMHQTEQEKVHAI